MQQLSYTSDFIVLSNANAMGQYMSLAATALDCQTHAYMCLVTAIHVVMASYLHWQILNKQTKNIIT